MSRKLTAFLLAILMLPLSAMNTIADEGDPDLSINEITFSDDSPTGGDTITITAEIANDGGASGLVSVTTNVSFYWDGNYIGKESITVPGSNTADAEMDWRAVGGSHTIKVIVDEEEQIRESDEDNNEEEEDIDVAYPPILLLDDDNSDNNGGFKTETDSYYVNSLDNMTTEMGYDIIRVNSGEDAPDYDTLSEYSLIIWACGTDYQSGDTDITFTNNDKENVADFLEGGGSLWAIGQDILYDFNTADGERNEGDFEYDYLGVTYVDHDRTTPAVLQGVDDDPISDGVQYDADAISSDFADDLNPKSGFEKVFSSGAPDDYNTSTIRTEEDFKVVFMTVDFSSITNSEDRDELMELVVEYLIEQLENDVSLSRFNTPKDGETVEPNVDNIVNVTVRNRGTEDQDSVQVSIDIRCLNNTYRFTDSETISLDTGEGAYVEFEWETPDDEDYVYEIKAEATISDDEKEDNNGKQISVNTYVNYDVALSEARVDPMIAEKDTNREMSVIVTNTGDVTMNSDISGKVYDGAGGTMYNGETQSTGDLSPGDSITLEWEWSPDEYGTFWFEAEVHDDDDEVPENDKATALMRSVDIEFSDDMEEGINGWTHYKSLSNPWHLIDTDEDENREAASPTHAMWVGDGSKGDGEYDNNWDFSLYTADNHTLGTNPSMSVEIWYSTEFSWDGGNVQISTDGGIEWEVITPDGGYPDDAVVGLDNEPGYTGTSGDDPDGETAWETANFNLGNYTNEDVKFRFRFGTDSSVEGYEGWYIDDFKIVNGVSTQFEDDFEDGTSDWEADVVLSEWHYYSKDEDYGKAYSGDYAWYLGNPDTGAYSASLNDSLETPTIDLGDGSEKYVSAMVWFGIDGPYDFVALEINVSGEWETIDTFPGNDGDYSEEYDDADENGWLYVESDVSEYEGDINFRLRFVSDTYTQYNGLYVDDFTLYSLPPIPNDVGTKDLNAPDTAKPGRAVSFTSNIYNFGTEDQNSFDVRGTVTRDDGTEVYNETQEVDNLDSKDNTTLDWTWEGGPNGTYTIRVETLLEDDERAGNNPKEKVIDVAESGYQVALAVEEQAKEVLSGESVFFNFTATNTGENSGYYDITVDYVSEQDEWKIISHVTTLYLTSGSSQDFTVVVIAPTLAPLGDEHSFSVTVTSRDDPDTEDTQEISATPLYYEQNGGDKVLLIDANFGKNNGYNNYYNVDDIDVRMKDTLQEYFGEGESRGYDVYTIPYDNEAGAYGELYPYPTNELMTNYDVVIWVQGDHHQRNLTNWKNCISDYLDAGGSMWIMGQQYLTALNSSTGSREAGTFEHDYLKIKYVSDSSGTPNPMIGVEDDEIFNEAEYDMGDRSIYSYDYADWIRPTDDAVGAFYTGKGNWWHIVDTEEDSNRKANSPTHSMWIGDESKENGEYHSGWDYSIYTSDSFSLGVGGQLRFQHYYDTESATYPYDGGNVQISTDEGENWEVIHPSGGYPADSVTGLDGEAGYYGDSNGWVQASFDLGNFSGEDVRFRFRFGSDGVVDSYEGWYFDDVELTDTSGSLFSDDMEAGMSDWNDSPQIYNMSLHYDGDYRLIVSPFTFAFVNNSDDRDDMVGRGLDWLRAAAAADDVGVKLLEIESATEENSTIAFSSIIKNYGSEDQAAFNVEGRVVDSEGNELWSQTQLAGPLQSGEEETLDWEWDSGNPDEVTIIVETLKDDENHRNDIKEENIEIVMICIPEVTTFNDHKQGQPGDDVIFDLIVSNRASGTDIMEIEMTGSASGWGQIANEMELKSNESRDLELALKIDEDAEYDDYDLIIIVTASDGTVEELELLVTVTDNPVNYEVEIELDPTNAETIAGQDVEFTVTIHNKGDEQDTFDLEASEEWVTFDEDEITIGADGQATVNGIISVPSDASNGNSYIDISATSRGDQSASDEKTIKVVVEELESGATLRRDTGGLITIAPGESGVFEFTLLSDSNGEQSLSIVTTATAGEWATPSITEVDLEAGEGTTFTVTVNVPAGTSEETYRLEVLIMNGDEELAKSVSNVIVQEIVEENMDIMFCLTDLSGFCLSSGNFEVTIEAEKIQTASVGFSVENLGNVDTEIAFEVVMPDGTTGSEVYFDENLKEWRIALSPSETELYPISLDAGDTMDWGAVAVIAREVSPGSYTFTVNLLKATETSTGSYIFENLEQLTITVIVEGETTEESAGDEEDDSLLPGPSFISVVAMLAIIVYRRRI